MAELIEMIYLEEFPPPLKWGGTEVCEVIMIGRHGQYGWWDCAVRGDLYITIECGRVLAADICRAWRFDICLQLIPYHTLLYSGIEESPPHPHLLLQEEP